MRIRWKFLIVLLCISLVPILVLRWMGRHSMRELGDDLAGRTRDVLIQRTSQELKSLVEEHATILMRERDLVEMALQVQVLELEKQFGGGAIQSTSDPAVNIGDSDADRVEFRPSTKHVSRMGMMGPRPLPVSYGDQTYRIPSSIGQQTAAEAVQRLAALVPVYRALERKHADLIFWQLTTLANGIQAVYPAVERIPMVLKAFKTQWYTLAREKKEIVWSKPGIDPFTMQMVFTVSKPFFRPDGSLVGVSAIVVPVDALLKVDEHISRLSSKVTSLLVRTETSTSMGKLGIRILARGQARKKMHHHWQAATKTEWLEIQNGHQFEELIGDLQNQIGGVRQIDSRGRSSLLAYRCIDDYCTALVLIVPKEDVIREAVAMETYVHERIGRQIMITGVILVCVVLAIIALAFILSRSVTENISKLVAAARRVASGDFATRVRIHSRDEIGELGRTFNGMIPALEERVRMKQALDVAMEVQQNLLPRVMPRVKGLDIAAQSIYCDETGGDLYDFLELRCRNSYQIGIAVGDVSGHGISAALLMATVRAFLRSRVTQPGSLSEIINDVNRLVADDTSETGQFMTLFYAEIDPSEKSISWIRAGHDPAMLYSPDSDTFVELKGTGMALGIDGGSEYQSQIIKGLSQGQVLLIGTDGIWETQNESGEMFGKERLKALIKRYAHLSSKKMITSIIDELQAFRKSAKQDDDITLAVIKVDEN
jgi:sigma-B regulation protein RsbU (phosphoserine phosphatase)